jgi:hypothetical protein
MQSLDLQLLILKLPLQLLNFTNLAHSLHQIILLDIIPVLANSKHTSLSNDVPQISAVEILTQLDERLVIDLAFFVDCRGVDFEDLESAYFVGEGDFDFTVETAGTKEGGVEGVGTICRHDDFCLAYQPSE